MHDVAEILKYYNEYGSIREVQKRTRISRNTIAKYLARVEDNKSKHVKLGKDTPLSS